MVKQTTILVLLGIFGLCGPLVAMKENFDKLPEFPTGKMDRSTGPTYFKKLYTYLTCNKIDSKTKNETFYKNLPEMRTLHSNNSALFVLADTAFIHNMLTNFDKSTINTTEALEIVKIFLIADKKGELFVHEKTKKTALDWAENALNFNYKNNSEKAKSYIKDLIELYKEHAQTLGLLENINKKKHTNLVPKFSSAKSRIFVYALIFGGVSLGGWALWKFFRSR